MESSLSETLFNYGVTSEQLKEIDVSVKSPSGFQYWFIALAPFLIPSSFFCNPLPFQNTPYSKQPGKPLLSYR